MLFALPSSIAVMTAYHLVEAHSLPMLAVLPRSLTSAYVICLKCIKSDRYINVLLARLASFLTRLNQRFSFIPTRFHYTPHDPPAPL